VCVCVCGVSEADMIPLTAQVMLCSQFVNFSTCCHIQIQRMHAVRHPNRWSHHQLCFTYSSTWAGVKSGLWTGSYALDPNVSHPVVALATLTPRNHYMGRITLRAAFASKFKSCGYTGSQYNSSPSSGR